MATEPVGAAAPTVAGLRRELGALGSDDWARVLPHLRGALHDLDATAVTRDIAQLRATPPGRLASGRNRTRLIAVATEAAAAHVIRRLGAATFPTPLDGILDRAARTDVPVATPVGDAAAPTAASATGERAAADVGGNRSDSKQRVKQARAERDEARRQLAGAQARVARESARADTAEAEVAALRSRLTEVERERDAASGAVDEAVARTERRGASELAELREQLRVLRRREQERTERERRRVDAAEAAERAAAGEVAARRAEKVAARADRGIPAARPTLLPDHLRPDTGGAARALLASGRDVLVDGYNVTKTHRPGLSLEHQRSWLLALVEPLARRRDLTVTVVLDAAEGPGSSVRRPSGVVVRFTSAELTADDEIEFEVASLPDDRPILVVTDDRELRDRVTAYRVDTIGTSAFLHAVQDA